MSVRFGFGRAFHGFAKRTGRHCDGLRPGDPVPGGIGAATLKTAVDGTFAPHAMPRLCGGYEGFNIDLANEIAKRLKRKS